MTRRPSRAPQLAQQTRIIACISFKGGVGKTTTTAHVAAHLSRLGPTIAVDGDVRVGSLRTWASGGKLPFEVLPLIEAMRRAPRFIVIDVRGGLPDAEVEDLAQACDMLLLPGTPETLSLDGLRKTMDMIEDLRERQGARAEARAVLTMARPGNRLLRARRALKALEVPTMESSIRYSEAYKDATETGVLVGDVKTNSLARECWLDYGRLVDEMLAVMGE